MSSSQHSFLSQPRSRPKPLLISCEMPTAPLSTFVHMVSLKMDQLHSSSDPIARPPVNKTECVYTDLESLRQKSDLLEAVSGG